jgi:hypothetical protein
MRSDWLHFAEGAVMLNRWRFTPDRLGTVEQSELMGLSLAYAPWHRSRPLHRRLAAAGDGVQDDERRLGVAAGAVSGFLLTAQAAGST